MMDPAIITTAFGTIFSLLMGISLFLLNRIYRAIDGLLAKVGEHNSRLVRLEVSSEHQGNINKSFIGDFKEMTLAVTEISTQVRSLRENCIAMKHLKPPEE